MCYIIGKKGRRRTVPPLVNELLRLARESFVDGVILFALVRKELLYLFRSMMSRTSLMIAIMSILKAISSDNVTISPPPLLGEASVRHS